MHLCGPANWWLPRWLDRHLPHLSVEAPPLGPPVPAPRADLATAGVGR
jgi:RND superfamily putative drug exporter